MLNFINFGPRGAVFHVYDQLNLNRIPRRYTVGAFNTLSDNHWNTRAANYVPAPPGTYNLWVYGPNGFVRVFRGRITEEGRLNPEHPEVGLAYDIENAGIHVSLCSNARETVRFTLVDDVYRTHGLQTISVRPEEIVKVFWPVRQSGNWYDFSIKGENGYYRQFAGRVEDGKDHITDPMMGRPIAPYFDPAPLTEPARA